jgi:hypothetical protein
MSLASLAQWDDNLHARTLEVNAKSKAMLEISTAKVAHVIVRARECDVKVGSWEDRSEYSFRDCDADSVLENFSNDATRSELMQFISNLNEDEQASLVALAWIGRGSFVAEELDEAIATARSENVNNTEDYLLGMPMLADFLEEGLDKLGYSVEEVEEQVL